MKHEYVSLTPLGIFALFTSGFGFGYGVLLPSGNVNAIILALLLILVARADALDRPQSGEYVRRWCVWRRIGPLKP